MEETGSIPRDVKDNAKSSLESVSDVSGLRQNIGIRWAGLAKRFVDRS